MTERAAEVGAFAGRHIGTDSDAQATMLAAVGYDSVDALVRAAVPPAIQSTAVVSFQKSRFAFS